MRTSLTVLKKELLENARDRRTLLSAFIFGPLFGPALFAVLVNVLVSQATTSVEQPIEVPIVAADQAPNLVAFLRARGVEDLEDPTIKSLDDATTAVESGAHDLVILIDAGFARSFERDGSGRIGLVYDQSNSRAGSKVQRARAAILGYSQQLGALRLLARGVEFDAVFGLNDIGIQLCAPAGPGHITVSPLS